jgi:hypothetical protein
MPKGKEPITTQEYKHALNKCKNNKSADKDGLSAELVKLGGEAMEPHLHTQLLAHRAHPTRSQVQQQGRHL